MLSGYLDIYMGPMYSGKTTKLIELYDMFNELNTPVICINHEFDKPVTNTQTLSNHNGTKVDCIYAESIMNISSEIIGNYQVVLINEAQFFGDLYDGVVQLLEHNIKIVVFGLDGDYKQQKFGQILDLIPICDTVIKLSANCNCGRKPAPFSRRIDVDINNQVATNKDCNYIPQCRVCLTKKINK